VPAGEGETTACCTYLVDSRVRQRRPLQGTYREERERDHLEAVSRTASVVDAALPPSAGKEKGAKVLSHADDDGPALVH